MPEPCCQVRTARIETGCVLQGTVVQLSGQAPTMMQTGSTLMYAWVK
jgi:hypothetical protein